MAERILARASGQPIVKPGEYLSACPDRLMINDMIALMLPMMEEVGLDHLPRPDKPVIIFDHLVPAPSPKEARIIAEATRALARFNLPHFLGAVGVSHQVMCERGFVEPGTLVLGTDSHSTMYGALGAAGAGIGATEMVYALAMDSLWFQVPATIRFDLQGELPRGVYAKDLVLSIIGRFGGDYARYRAVEYGGEGAASLTLSNRMTIANMGVELGAKFAMFEADQAAIRYLSDCGVNAAPFGPEEGARYEARHAIDLSCVEPQFARPGSPDNVASASEMAGTRIDQAYLGSCTNARADDIAIAAQLLKGKRIAPHVRLLVAPASQQVMAEASRSGDIAALVEAGAIILPAGCGACAGLHRGLLGDGDVCISSTNRNFTGRMGSPLAEVYLGSPAAVAAAALTGEICDPRSIGGDL